MRGLASYVMQGRAQALMVAAVLAMLSLILPPVSLLSSAVAALVTLRRGAVEGLVLIGAGALVCGALAWMLLGEPLGVLGVVLVVWMPVWALAVVLQATRAFSLTVQAALGFGFLLILVYYVQATDPLSAWGEMLEPLRQSIVEAQLLDQDQSQALVSQMAVWMTGILAAGFSLQLTLALCIARWWQAMLYNPGGFREEFHNLRLHRALGLAALPVFGMMLIGGEATVGFVRYAGLVLAVGFMLQGLAVVHNLRLRSGAHQVWLVVLYVLLFIAMVHTALALAAVGLADVWLDFRARYRARTKTGQGPD